MYATETFYKEGIDFSAVFPSRQDTLRSANYDFGLLEIAKLIQSQSNNFKLEKPELVDMDAQLSMIVERYKEEEGIGVAKGRKIRQPKPEPELMPEPELEPEPEPELMPEPELEPEPEPSPEEDEEPTAEQMRQEMEAYTEILAVTDKPEDRAFYESEIDALAIALLYKE
jgi:hypothetical protein